MVRASVARDAGSVEGGVPTEREMKAAVIEILEPEKLNPKPNHFQASGMFLYSSWSDSSLRSVGTVS